MEKLHHCYLQAQSQFEAEERELSPLAVSPLKPLAATKPLSSSPSPYTPLGIGSFDESIIDYFKKENKERKKDEWRKYKLTHPMDKKGEDKNLFDAYKKVKKEKKQFLKEQQEHR